MKQLKLTKKVAPLIISIVVLLMVAAVAVPTLAYYLRSVDNPIEQDYTPAEPYNPSIKLTADNNSIRNVSIEVPNNEGYPFYVRVALVVTWQAKVGSEVVVHSQMPSLNGDYTYASAGRNWQSVNGFWYYTPAVEGNGKVEPIKIDFISNLTLTQNPFIPYVDSEKCHLNVEIIVQTIQAIGSTDNGDIPAWQDAWGLTSWPTN